MWAPPSSPALFFARSSSSEALFPTWTFPLLLGLCHSPRVPGPGQALLQLLCLILYVAGAAALGPSVHRAQIESSDFPRCLLSHLEPGEAGPRLCRVAGSFPVSILLKGQRSQCPGSVQKITASLSCAQGLLPHLLIPRGSQTQHFIQLLPLCGPLDCSLRDRHCSQDRGVDTEMQGRVSDSPTATKAWGASRMPAQVESSRAWAGHHWCPLRGAQVWSWVSHCVLSSALCLCVQADGPRHRLRINTIELYTTAQT